MSLFSVTMNLISITLTGNEDRHKISDKFELWPDLINHFGVTCPCNCYWGERLLPSWATCLPLQGKFPIRNPNRGFLSILCQQPRRSWGGILVCACPCVCACVAGSHFAYGQERLEIGS